MLVSQLEAKNISHSAPLEDPNILFLFTSYHYTNKKSCFLEKLSAATPI
jgi:hypothetical protein